jgi:hypothetical protein
MKLSNPTPHPCGQTPQGGSSRDTGGVVGVSDTTQWMRSMFVASPRPISTGQLEHLTVLPSPAYQPSRLLGALTLTGVGDLILEQASRLDAFSGYPFRT